MNTTQKIEDPLTRLHNRVSFLKLLQRRILDANEYHSKLALVLINVNQLNRINHQHGYDAGDEVLCQFANLLEEVRREQDHVARIGDNRFVLLLRDVMNKGHAKLAALKVLKCLEQPFEVNGENGAIFFDLEDPHILQYFKYADPETGKKIEDHLTGWQRIHVTNFEHPYMKAWWVPGCTIGYEHTFINAMADFLEGLETGKPAQPDFRCALRTQRVCDTVLESARTGQWLDIASE